MARMNSLHQLTEALRFLKRSIIVKLKGFKKYEGGPEQICRKIIMDCYEKNNDYFRTSTGNYCQFWTRDFGMCCESLIKLGYKDKARNTLIFAMDKFMREGEITTHITPKGKLIDFPRYTPESAAYMLHSLLSLDDKVLLKKYKSFFEKTAKKIFENDIDKETGLVRPDINYSTMKDHAIRESCCYLNCLLGMLANDLKKAGIKSELSRYDYPKIIMQYFWKKDHFIDDLSGVDVITGDANTFPFWTGLITDKKIFNKVQKAIERKKLDKPFPLKYTSKEDVPKEMHFYDFLSGGYERDTIFLHLSLCYLKVIDKFDKKLMGSYLKKITDKVLLHKNFLEIYDGNGKVFRRLLYESDEGMLWCSIYLELLLETRKL